VHENELPATCTSAGSYEEVVCCSVCGEELSREEKTIPALGHAYTLTGWNWDGYESATATFTCGNDESHVETIEAIISSERTEPTVNAQGSVVYTATVEFEGKPYTDTKTEVLPALKPGWQEIDGAWYYYNADGTLKTGWLKSGSSWFYLDPDGGAMVTGWKKVSGTWYYFKSNGAMATGWQKVGSTWYYFQSSGAMVTGWQKISNVWYYFKSSGAMVTGWQKISNKWYYFESSGAMKTGWLKDGGKWYYLDSSGAMLVSTSKTIGGKTYYFNSSGVCTNP
jgi:glucan-binding YG repeat protein